MDCKSLVKNEILKSTFSNDEENSDYQFINNVLSTINKKSGPETSQAKKKTKYEIAQNEEFLDSGKKSIKDLLNCQRCGKMFLTKQDLNNHMKMHKKEKHKCQKCDRAFVSKNSLAYHMKSHSGIQYECDICNRKFNDNSNMKKHRNIHLGIKKYKCGLCFKEFSDPTGFKQHKNQHEGVRYKCEFCTKSFRAKRSLRDHIQEKHLGVKKVLTCEMCSKEFTSPLYLLIHKNKDHLKVKYECALCDLVFYTKEKMKIHIITHPEMNLICVICKKRFREIKTYRKHVSAHSGYVPCPHCNKQVKGKVALSLHIKTMHRKVACKLCGQVFASVGSHKGHMISKHNFYPSLKNKRYPQKEKMSFECFHCGQKYIRRESIKNHVLSVHLRTDPIVCDLCNFSTVSPLTMKCHNGSHPYVKYICLHCQKKFHNPESFKEHLSTHFDFKVKVDGHHWKDYVEKFVFTNRFNCDKCRKSFPDKKRLKIHINAIHLNIKYTCDYCRMYFYQLSVLKEHLKTHDGVEYQCSYCKKFYRTKKYLQLHLRRNCLKKKDFKCQANLLKQEAPELKQEQEVRVDPV